MFQVGGEIGYQLNGGITGPTAEFKEYGTRVDFVPIVLGKGRINLQVRAMVTEIDAANSVGPVPALRTRQTETGVELQAGQTLAIAGLLQNRIESENRGLPWISEVPILGIPFRRVEHSNNEVELLILVTPQLVDAMDPEDVPQCLPGQRTTDPCDWELYVQGHLEVPNCCPDGDCNECKQGSQGSQSGPAVAPEGAVIIEQHERVVAPQAGDSARVQPRRVPAPGTSGPARTTWRPTNGATGQNRQTRAQQKITQTSSQSAEKIVKPAFIGAIGYDAVK
jgi:pilus assembly protein CpaC